jgi:hypothetical protein
MLLVRMGLPGAADDLARIVYAKVKPLHLSLPSLADECPRVGAVPGGMKSVLIEQCRSQSGRQDRSPAT